MVRRFAFVVTLVVVCVVGALGLAAPLRLSPMHSTSKSLLKMSSVATPPSPVSVLQRITNAATYLARNPLRLQYATAMSARFGWFLNQGIALSVAGIDRSSAADEERMRANRQGLSVPSVLGALVDAVVNDEDFALPSSGVDALTGDAAFGNDAQRELFGKNFASIIALLRRDLSNIEAGLYKFPYDMQPTYRPQWSGSRVLSQLRSYVSDRRAVLDRRDRRDGLEIRNTYASPKYPEYYLQNFHYQTDGWLSAKSARLYDYQVESLFLGTADAMRRQIMPEIAAFMRGKDPRDVKLLDVASGTGRFVSFVLDNYPSLDTTVLDLSPFYLAEAQKLLRRFAPANPNIRFVEAAVEGLPFPDASFDAITCVYLFHELPAEIRLQAAKEFARVLKPGGKLFFVDSAQKGEVPYERVLEGFTISAHEPYYMDYTETDLSALFGQAGLTVETTGVHWVSKSVTLVKA